MPSGKVLPYEPSIRVPLLMRGPGDPARRGPPRRSSGTATSRRRSSTRPARARRSRSTGARCSRRAGSAPPRDVLLEGPPARGTNGLPRFTGLRTRRYTYVEHVRGARELYDLRADPDQLRQPRARARRALGAGARRRLARAARLRAASAAARQRPAARTSLTCSITCRPGGATISRTPGGGSRAGGQRGEDLPSRAACAPCAREAAKSVARPVARTRRRRGA